MQSAAGDAARSARITTELSKTLGRIQLDASELVLLYGYVNTKQQLTLHDFIAADAEKLRDRAAFEKFLLEQAAHRCGGSELCGVYVRKEVEVESGAIVDALREDWFSEFFEFLLNGECVVVVGGEDGVEEVWKVAGDHLSVSKLDLCDLPPRVAFNVKWSSSLLVKSWSSGTDSLIRSVEDAFFALQSKIRSAHAVVFDIGSDSGGRYLLGRSAEGELIFSCKSASDKSSLASADKSNISVKDFALLSNFRKSKPSAEFHLRDLSPSNWIPTKLLTQHSASADDRALPPLITIPQKSVLSYPVKLDCVAVLMEDAPLASVPIALMDSLTRQLTMSQICITKAIGEAPKVMEFAATTIPPIEVSHFLLTTPVIRLLSGVTPVAETRDSPDEPYLHYLSSAYRLPNDIPSLSPNASLKHNAQLIDNYLPCIHEHLPPLSSQPGSDIATVRGLYTYHHYLHDNVKDKGWGCAYRSLQTLFSWFKFAGYTRRPIPSLREVQDVLVRIGDKPQSFAPSRQWIGSMEVGFVLNELLKIETRTLSVSNGDEMPTLARQLLHHFRHEHAPVMIGGGQLAHTILGVQFSETDGHCRWLVLDPHYTGVDNVEQIVSKGWCEWKETSFWNAKTFYNLCLPIRKKVKAAV